MIGELTTDRPLSNDDRRNLWHEKRRTESNPKPIPSRAHDWGWHHPDYEADAIQQIQEITSPAVAQGHPEGVKFYLQVCRDALGYVLFTAVLLGWLALLNWMLDLL